MPETNQEIQAFLDSYFKVFGIKPVAVGQHLFEVVLGQEKIRFTLNSESGAEAEYLTYGHPLLDQLLAQGRRQGGTANYYKPINSSYLVGLEKALARIPIHDAAKREISYRLVYQPKIVFNFRVALLADIRREELLTVAADPESGEVSLWELPQDFVGLPKGFRPLPDRRRRPRTMHEYDAKLHQHLAGLKWLRDTDYRTYYLYKNSCRFVEYWANEEYADFETEQLKRLAAEEEKLNQYYEDLIAEKMAPLYDLLHKAAVLEVRVALAKRPETLSQFQSALNALQEEIAREKEVSREHIARFASEKGKRVHELRHKFLPQIRVSLVSTAKYHLPRARVAVKYNLANASGMVNLVYDFYSAAWLAPSCDSCGEPAQPLALAEDGQILCRRCWVRCEVCGAMTTKPGETCKLCGKLVCSICVEGCSLQPQHSCGYCTACAKSVCVECTGLARLGLLQE